MWGCYQEVCYQWCEDLKKCLVRHVLLGMTLCRRCTEVQMNGKVCHKANL